MFESLKFLKYTPKATLTLVLASAAFPFAVGGLSYALVGGPLTVVFFVLALLFVVLMSGDLFEKVLLDTDAALEELANVNAPFTNEEYYDFVAADKSLQKAAAFFNNYFAS